MFDHKKLAFGATESLSKREWLFGMILQGLAANPTVTKGFQEDGDPPLDSEKLVMTAGFIFDEALRQTAQRKEGPSAT